MLEPRAAPGSFVGRAEELERLEVALAAAADGRGSTVLVAGEAGIGKTRLTAELAERARRGRATVLGGRCIDLVGAGLPYLPLVEALRPLRGSSLLADVPGGLHELPRLLPELAVPDAPADRGGADSQFRLFEEVLAVLERLSAAAPLVLLLEDLHWADDSTLDLVAFLAHAVRDRRMVLVATYRSDELRPGDPLQRLVAALVRAREAIALELEPLDRDELGLLLSGAAEERLPADVAAAISARSEGNPFFAEELLAAAVRGETTLPRIVRDVLLQRVAGLDPRSRAVLRVAAAAGRDVPYGLLAAIAPLPEPQLVEALRQAVEHGVFVPDSAAGAFRFRHALLAEAVYATLLPGEREEVHGRLARALSEDPRLGTARAAAGELAQHWAAAGRTVEALTASLRAAREAEAVSGLAEARRHLERALELWGRVPAAEESAGLPLPEVLLWAAELAYLTGGADRAAELARRAIGLIEEHADTVRLGVLHECLGRYLYATDDRARGLESFERAVALVPAEPPSAERVSVLAAIGTALAIAWRHADSRAFCEEALAVADAIGDDRPALRALDALGVDLCYLGRPEQGWAHLLDARRRAEDHGTPWDVTRNYWWRSEVLLKTGRLHEAARVALEGLTVVRRFGHEWSGGMLLAGSAAGALLGTGDWARAVEVLAAGHRARGAFWAHSLHVRRAELAIGRGDFETARRNLQAGAHATVDPQSTTAYACLLAELALWEGRSEEAAGAVGDGLRTTTTSTVVLDRTRLCALGVRAAAEQAQLAAVRRDAAAVESARRRARQLLEEAHTSASEAAAVAPDAAAWRAVAEAEYGRVEGRCVPELWQAAAADELVRPYLAAQCRWRQAEALVAAGRAAAAVVPAREAHRVAIRLGARPLQRELELLAQRARLDLIGLRIEDSRAAAGDGLGLTAREGEVLHLLGRGYTNRDIARELTISVKTASVHVSHILDRLGVANRFEAAALAHRLTAPGVRGERADPERARGVSEYP
jgi:DNA-binding CsgD family transcriptional regulator/tetratricopeptide (TPR) repeat protein